MTHDTVLDQELNCHKNIRILATSDLHGKFYPWDYALNQESRTGSVAQLATAIRDYRDEKTLLVDAGDTIQDNFAGIFVGDGVHPMIQGINAIGYDVCVVGNHDFNFGMDVVKKTISDLKATTLVGNVYDTNQKPITEGYRIFSVDGIRVAVIGMVTPNIVRWDAVHLKGCTVTDPLDETRKILKSISGMYDVLVGVFHMGIKNEYGLRNSGVTDICEACPEFDIVVSSHEHALIPDSRINGVLVVQNKCSAETLSVIDINLIREDGKWCVTDKKARSVSVSEYDEDPDMMKQLQPYDEQARKEAEEAVGNLEEDALVAPNEIEDVPRALLEDTAVINLINTVQMYYAGAKVSATILCTKEANILPGVIRKCDISKIYKYTNLLYKLHMTGSQLKRYMEWSAQYYNTFHEGDLTISFNPEVPMFNYDIFDGVCYELDIAQEPGIRLFHLTWPDGSEVKDEDEFDIAVNDYRANSLLLVPGAIFEADDMQVLVEMDVRGDIGGVRELICDYIVNVCGGVIRPDKKVNWKLVGYQWDKDEHQKAIDLLRSGKIKLPESYDGRHFNIRGITSDDISMFE